jgi:MFS family permease
LKDVILVLRAEPRARWFFLALTQSALGTGAAYVALLLVAYERLASPWAISLVLLADLLPAMLLGPVFGAVADRWSRRWCAVGSDVVRAFAFVGIAFADSFTLTVGLAALAGAGTALFTPSTLAALPSLVSEERRPAATSLYGAIADLGFTAGPGLAAAALTFAGPEELLGLNGLSFAVCAVILALTPFGAVAPTEREESGFVVRSLFRDAREGVAVVARLTGVRVVIAASAAALFFGGAFNVGELLFATEELRTSDAGYSILVALFGLGFVGGSLAGSGGGSPEMLRRRFVQGCTLMGLGFLLSGLSPTLLIALLTFTLAGFGNGLLLVHERIIVQETVPDRLLGRAYGVKDALASWAFGTAFLAAGGILTVIDARGLIVASGVGGLMVAAACAVALRREAIPRRPTAKRRRRAVELARRPGAFRGGAAGEEGPDAVGTGDGEGAPLDHTH